MGCGWMINYSEFPDLDLVILLSMMVFIFEVIIKGCG